MARWSWGIVLVAACGGDKTTESGDTGSGAGDTTGQDTTDTTGQDTTDTTDTTPTDSGTPPAPCVLLVDGTWDADGPAIGMPMTGTLTMNPAKCIFTLSDWNMAMSMPMGGMVDGDQITLAGQGWSTCTATAQADGMHFEGTCGSQAFTFDYAP